MSSWHVTVTPIDGCCYGRAVFGTAAEGPLPDGPKHGYSLTASTVAEALRALTRKIRNGPSHRDYPVLEHIAGESQ